MPWAFNLAWPKAGSNMAAKIAMIAMTTSNSIRVKPPRGGFVRSFFIGLVREGDLLNTKTGRENSSYSLWDSGKEQSPSGAGDLPARPEKSYANRPCKSRQQRTVAFKRADALILSREWKLSRCEPQGLAVFPLGID